MPPSVQLLVIVVAIVAFWAIVMRPARKQQQRVQDLQSELEVGQEVVLSAGILGTIVAIEDQKVRLEIAPGVVITVARQVVVRRAETLEAAPDAAPDDAPESHPESPSAEAEDRGETK